ncbi:MAG: hypothetical protein HRU28_03445 [Rhizobiales bacterium]|nr:hypothetical protein [Hyphomicrobiales bacterium]
MNILKFMPIDKAMHLLGGGAIAGAFMPLGIIITLGIVIGAAIGKEIVIDKFTGGRPDITDVLVTILGGVIVVGLYQLMTVISKALF